MNKDFVKNIIKKLDLEHNKPNANLIDNNLLLTLDSYSINIISDLLFTSETKTIDDLINENMGFIIDDFLHICNSLLVISVTLTMLKYSDFLADIDVQIALKTVMVHVMLRWVGIQQNQIDGNALLQKDA